MPRTPARLLLACLSASGLLYAQAVDQKLLRDTLKLSPAEIQTIAQGQPVVREELTPDKSEVLMYGVVFVAGQPEKFLKTYADVEKLVDGKTYLAAKYFSNPPSLANLSGLTLDNDDIQELKSCTPGDCDLQLPANEMTRIRAGVNWSQGDAANRANQLVRQMAFNLLVNYQKSGNHALGVYQDKEMPINVEHTFRTVLSRAKDLPAHQPQFAAFLTNYPAAKPTNTWDFFHWEVVKFGLKPTFRMNHVVFHQPPARPSAWVVASKQLYASHYFQSALDLWFCVPASQGGKQGYYLTTVKGSRQDGLTGLKGKLLRGIAINRTTSSMRDALARLKQISESGR